MNGFYTIRINFLGGIVSPGELKDLLLALKGCEVKNIRFGLRQQIIFHLSYLHETTFKQRMEALKIDFYVDSNPHPNVVSSYVSEEVFQQGNWLSEGIYKDIFDTFNYNPRLKINISDSSQSFTPFFSGHLNFVSSSHPNFWHLFVRKPKTNVVEEFGKLIFSNEIGKLAKCLEGRMMEGEEELFESLPSFISEERKEALKLPKFSLPYYEGFNRYGKKTWLGIYKRSELFSTEFLIDLCSLCLATKIGEICLTPWKSLIIKNINEKDRKSWSSILAKYDINVRHAANELNWQIEDASPKALLLKQKLIEYFNKKDLRTFGICLGIKTVPKTEVFASIMVRKRSFGLYDITHTTDYDPNGREIAYYSRWIPGFMLPQKLRKSILEFNRHIADKVTVDDMGKASKESHVFVQKELYQCQACLSMYDEEYGDVLNEIPAGTAFSELSENYCCPVCQSEKQTFQLFNQEQAGSVLA